MNIKKLIHLSLKKTTLPKKIHIKPFKQNLKILFINKPTLIFLFVFLFINVFLYIQYAETIKIFATIEKSFTLAEVIEQQIPPVDFLSNNFTCETKQAIPGCDNYFYIALLIFILLEGFVIYLFIKNRKKIQKKILVPYSVFLQLLLIVPLLAIGYAPYRAFDILGEEANKEIIKSISLLNNKEELKKLSIGDNLTAVSKKIEIENDLPTLMEDDPKEQAILQILGIKQNKKDSLYKVLVIPHQAYYAPEISPEKEKIKFELLLFPDNTLIIHSVNRNLIEELTPVLANKIVKSKFSDYVKNIRILPKVDVPEEKEYLAIRQKEKEETEQEFLDYIEDLRSNIAYNQSVLSKNEANIIEIDREYDRYKSYGDGWLSTCRREFGEGDIDCKNGAEKIASELQELLELRKQNEENNKNIKFYISESRGYLFLSQKNYEEFRNNPIPPETEEGVFRSPNIIHLKYKPSDVHTFSAYLSTAIHEYLHFYSYSTSLRGFDLPKFLNEGITDYLTSIAIDDFLNYETEYTYIGYFNEVGIVEKIVLVITEDELKNIYFNQNENRFKNSIDSILSQGTYDVVKGKGNQLFITSMEDKKTQESLKRQIHDLLSKEKVNNNNNKKN